MFKTFGIREFNNEQRDCKSQKKDGISRIKVTNLSLLFKKLK